MDCIPRGIGACDYNVLSDSGAWMVSREKKGQRVNIYLTEFLINHCVPNIFSIKSASVVIERHATAMLKGAASLGLSSLNPRCCRLPLPNEPWSLE
jgi:hypothetical protein